MHTERERDKVQNANKQTITEEGFFVPNSGVSIPISSSRDAFANV